MQHPTQSCPFQLSARLVIRAGASLDGKLGPGLADRAILSLGQPPKLGDKQEAPSFCSAVCWSFLPEVQLAHTSGPCCPSALYRPRCPRRPLPGPRSSLSWGCRGQTFSGEGSKKCPGRPGGLSSASVPAPYLACGKVRQPCSFNHQPQRIGR